MMMQYSEICMYYLRGACRFGIKCWNSHDLNHRSPKTQALAAATTESYYEENHSITSPETNTSTGTSSTTSTSTSTSASASTSTSTSTSGQSTPIQAQGLQLLLEASMKPILRPSDDSEMEIENVATELSTAMKTGNGKSVKETASKLQALHQKKMKEWAYNAPWNELIRGAVDTDLQCNICFEIFIKPIVLNCSHTFCESCINVWTKRVKRCPICRVQIKSRSFCLTLDNLIEKIVEQLPKEIKQKRGLIINDRNKIKIDKPQSSSRFNGIDVAALLSLEELIEADSPLQFIESDEEDEENDDIDEDMIVEEAEMIRMNLHDTVVSTRGVNPLMSYVVGAEEQTSNGSIAQPRNSSVP